MMNYRSASSRDAPLLAALNQQLIQDEGHRNPMSIAELKDRMEEWLAGEKGSSHSASRERMEPPAPSYRSARRERARDIVLAFLWI
jgi:hypothetical protein